MLSREHGCLVGWEPHTHLDAKGSIGLLSPCMHEATSPYVCGCSLCTCAGASSLYNASVLSHRDAYGSIPSQNHVGPIIGTIL